MLFLLRNIRRKLLSGNKVITYLLYAIGEIFLVVVGILIAVQIDDWNEDRISKIRQEKQIILIKNEMINNLHLLEIEWKRVDEMMDKQLRFLALFNEKTITDTLSEKAFAHLYFEAYNIRVLTPIENSALNELIASGGLKDIKNDSIRKAISSWDARLLSLREQQDYIQINDRALNQFLVAFPEFSMRQYIVSLYPDTGIELLSQQKSNKQILSSQEFENILILIHGQSRRVRNIIFPKYKNDLMEMISSLDKELSKL